MSSIINKQKKKWCKICWEKIYANTSWCLDHFKEREKEKKNKKKKEPKKIKEVKKIKKQSKKTSQQIKKTIHNRVWRLMSEYVRRKWADKDWFNTCYTCSYNTHWKNLQAGHFKHWRLDFDERNLKPQCLTSKSNILMADWLYKNISKIKEWDRLNSFNEKTFNNEVSIVNSVKKFIPDLLFEIETSDWKTFEATIDHKIVVNWEWKTIEELIKLLKEKKECCIMEIN